MCQQLKSRSGNLTPCIHPLTIEKEADGHQCRSRHVRNISLAPGVDSKTDQLVVSLYTAPPTPCEEDLKLKYHLKWRCLMKPFLEMPRTFLTCDNDHNNRQDCSGFQLQDVSSCGWRYDDFLDYTFQESHWQLSQMRRLRVK